MKWNRILRVLALLIGLLLGANLLVGGGPAAMVDTARSRCVNKGFPAQNMKVLRYDCNDGRFGFGGHGRVEFGPDATDPSRVLRVELRKRMNLFGWEAETVVWHRP